MMKVYKFHQFIALDRGPVNTCISNLLKGEVYQVKNHLLEKFENHCYEEIPGLIQTLEQAELIIQVEQDAFILPLYFKNPFDNDIQQIILELEEGVDIGQAVSFFSNRKIKIKMIQFFGVTEIDMLTSGIPVVKMSKDFSLCEDLSTVTGDFPNIDEATYMLNKMFHNCWGKKIAVTVDGNVRPCIYSQLVMGNIFKNTFSEIWQSAEVYRKLTKDKIEKCKDCELKFVCFDCREIARQKSGSLYATNPHCNYDPYKGEWKN
jgi:radical SAM protein with 4Fe4S-binding SPASM domain